MTSIKQAARFIQTPMVQAVAIASTIAMVSSQAASQALEEVVVTAQKRAQSMQDVPIAVSAFNQEALTEANLFDLASVAQLTPGLTIQSHSQARQQIYIRGIGSNTQGASNDASVVSFIDEVYIGRSGGTVFDLFDLERVEVLRGPQGTLYGKNAIGGAVNYITTKPTDDFYAKAELSAGDLDFLNAKALVSGPLSDTVAGKLSLSYRERDGYTDSLFHDEETGNVDRYGMRGGLRFLPSDTVEINLSADYSEADESPVGRYHGDDPNQTYTAAGRAYDKKAYEDPYTTFSNLPGFQEAENWGTSLRVDWDIDIGTFTSLTAYRESEVDYQIEIGYWSTEVPPGLPDSWNSAHESAEQFSQEFRLTGTAFDDNLDWVTGFYYLNEDVSRETALRVFVAAIEDIPSLGVASSEQENETNSYSIFADGTYHFTDNLSLTAGARYTYEKKDVHQVGVAPLVVDHSIEQDYDVETDESWDAFTPRLSLNWNVTDSAMLFFSAAEGFKSGGFDGSPASGPVAAATPFDPEEALQLEIGAKTDWLDNTLRLNLAVYSIDYQDLQVQQRVPAFPGDPIGIVITQNAAEASIDGAELEFTWAPLDGLEISGNYAYMDATYDEYLEPDGSDNAGNTLPRAPENTYTLVARYAHELSSGAELGARWQYVYRDEVQSDPQNDPYVVIPDYSTQALRAWYQSPDAQWKISAWVDNLTDEEYAIAAQPLEPFTNVFKPALPRTYGLTFEVQFGAF
jgi:iron complex outermembrane receptor protein